MTITIKKYTDSIPFAHCKQAIDSKDVAAKPTNTTPSESMSCISLLVQKIAYNTFFRYIPYLRWKWSLPKITGLGYQQIFQQVEEVEINPLFGKKLKQLYINELAKRFCTGLNALDTSPYSDSVNTYLQMLSIPNVLKDNDICKNRLFTSIQTLRSKTMNTIQTDFELIAKPSEDFKSLFRELATTTDSLSVWLLPPSEGIGCLTTIQNGSVNLKRNIAHWLIRD